jgi:outer membrane protein OmpA-like peptidoglycan-associated protein/tetratricopeptide (TPR) repeat protein
MKLKIYIAFILFSLMSCTGYRIDRAQEAESDLNYEEAIFQYEKLLPKHGSYEVYKNLAVLYLKRGDYLNAKQVYDSLIFKENYPKEDLLAYAEVLMANDDYKNAKIWVDRYLQENSSDEKAKTLRAILLNQGAFYTDTNQFTLELVDITATPQAYGAIPYKDGILYTGIASKTEKDVLINPWDGWPFSQVYYVVPVDSGWSSPYDLSHTLNEQYHVGPMAIDPSDPKVLYLSKSILADKKEAKKENRKDANIITKASNKIQLYKVGIENMRLDTPEILSFCKPEFNYAQATLSPEGTMMIFASDMSGGRGGSDLYISFYSDNKWSEPANMGGLNSEKNESFPYLVSEDTLYFSSESHGSYGGLDIFYSTFNGVKWTKPINLLSPINSYKDDFAISFKDDKKSGYISSNRSDLDKIYAFTMNRPSFRIEGLVINKTTQKPMPSIKITLTNRKTKKDSIVYSNSEGKFNFPLASDSKYKIMAEKNGYFVLSYNISTRGRTLSKVFNVVFEMEEIVLNKAIKIEEDTDHLSVDPENTRIKNIYYDFDKWDIRNDAILELDRLVWLFKDNPKLTIEISAHTDSRGSDEYNLKLSQKRADAVVAYLIDRGVDPSMLIAKGYGESQPVNKCVNGVPCTEAEYQENRRSEFKVVAIKK